MERAEFAALLLRLVDDGTIDTAQAADLLALYDAGDLGRPDLPQPPAQAIRGLDSNDVAAALLLLLLLLGRGASTTAPATMPTLASAARLALATQLQEDFGRTVGHLAARLARGEIAVGDWQAIMGATLRTHHSQMVLTGLGADGLTGAQLARMDALLREQMAYLSRYADQIAVRQMMGSAWGEGYLANRSQQYAGVAWEQFWRHTEEANEANGDTGWGWVYDYISEDDASTCDPCLEAEIEGPYLSGQGPYPGQICLGRGACRCERRARYDPVIYLALVGEQ